MDYIVEKTKIIINDKAEFKVKDILECGQIFTYEKTKKGYIVFSKNLKAELLDFEDKVEIITDDVPYFENFFDLKTSYENIKKSLINTNEKMKDMIAFGSGIRILKQDKLETIVGFIISANNNIPRIKNSMAYIRQNLGEKKDGFYAFPTLEKLAQADEDFFIKAGLGYRARQMSVATKQLLNLDLEKLALLPTNELKKVLLNVMGIGSKVADCILLFAYSKQDVFPVDTWIEKIHNKFFESQEKNRDVIRKELVTHFGNLSGYAQQYMFYYIRK